MGFFDWLTGGTKEVQPQTYEEWLETRSGPVYRDARDTSLPADIQSMPLAGHPQLQMPGNRIPQPVAPPPVEQTVTPWDQSFPQDSYMIESFKNKENSPWIRQGIHQNPHGLLGMYGTEPSRYDYGVTPRGLMDNLPR
jgi:hypothetical protein